MKLSKQFVTTLYMMLCKSLAEQTDIVPMLDELEIVENEGLLFVKNPPTEIKLEQVVSEKSKE